MAEWFVSCGIATAAMESTGVYWISPYDVLERHKVKPCLVDARGMKNVPARRDFPLPSGNPHAKLRQPSGHPAAVRLGWS